MRYSLIFFVKMDQWTDLFQCIAYFKIDESFYSQVGKVPCLFGRVSNKPIA